MSLTSLGLDHIVSCTSTYYGSFYIISLQQMVVGIKIIIIIIYMENVVQYHF